MIGLSPVEFLLVYVDKGANYGGKPGEKKENQHDTQNLDSKNVRPK